MATAHQQFSLKWNNYATHIVTALEELRVGDELTDVTLTADGQRIKAHKILLSACSVFFRETFKENPCKHPIVIMKGVTFQDLQAVVHFMYNGQVNVSQERLPSFLQTAEILQIKGLTDNPNEKDEGSVPAPSKKRHAFPNHQPISLQQENDRPPTPKRKRIIGSNNNNGTFATAQNSELPGTAASVISASGSGSSGASSNHSGSHHHHLHNNNNNSQSPLPPPLHAHNSDNSGDGLPPVKYEDQEDIDEEYERQDDTFQDTNDKDMIDRDADLSNSLGPGKIRVSNGTGERRPRYTMQPASNDVLPSATGIVDTSNVNGRLNGVGSRDLIFDGKQGSYVHANGFSTTNSNGYVNSSKLRNRLSSRSQSSTAYQHQEDRVIKYAPSHHDTRSNGSHEDGNGIVDSRFKEDGPESVPGSEEDERYFQQQLQQQQPIRRSSISQQHSKGRGTSQLVKTNGFHSSQPQQLLARTLSNGHIRGLNNKTNGGNGTCLSNSMVEDLSISSSTANEISTPNFSLTQQLLQQNVLSLISQNGGDGLKSSNGGGSTRLSAGSVPTSSSQPANGSAVGVNGEQGPIVAPYVCDVCGKRYVHHRSLNDHKKSHTGATRCPVCNKSFSKVANMRAHYAAQHSQPGDVGVNSEGDCGNNLNDDNQLIGPLSLKSSEMILHIVNYNNNLSI